MPLEIGQEQTRVESSLGKGRNKVSRSKTKYWPDDLEAQARKGVPSASGSHYLILQVITICFMICKSF